MANIKLNNNEYSIPDSMLTAPRADFVAHLATIEGDGIRVVVDGVEYNVDPGKVADAVADLETVLGGLQSGSGGECPLHFGEKYSTAVDQNGSKLSCIFYEDGSFEAYHNDNTLIQSAPAGTYIYSGYKILMNNGEILATINSDGTQITQTDGLIFTLETASGQLSRLIIK